MGNMPQEKARIVFIERQKSQSVSIERVFREISRHLPHEKFDFEFHKLAYGNGILGILKNLIFFRRMPADIYHITGHAHYMALVLPRERTILTIHDLIFLHTRTGLRRKVLKKLFLDWPLKRLKYVTTISESTKVEILKHLDSLHEKLRVIENPIFSEFVTNDGKAFNKENPVILQVGTTNNKNISRLITAIAGLTCKLRIIGTLDVKIEDELMTNNIDYENVAGVGDGEMREEYRNCDIVSFCSTYEGFGLPIIEAQAMRKPVITSDLEPMRSVAGGAAVLVDPNIAESIKQGILSIIYSENLRSDLAERGLENIKRFDPKTISRKYAELYDEVLGN